MRETTKPSATVTEDIDSFTSYYYVESVRVKVVQLEVTVSPDPDGGEDITTYSPVKSIPVETFMVAGQNYKALMSGNPPWATGKPEGDFRKEDLWACVDAIRNGVELEIGVVTPRP